MFRKSLGFFSIFFFLVAPALASEPSNRTRARDGSVNTLIRVEILKHYPGSRVELLGEVKKIRGDELSQPSEAVFQGDNARGEAFIALREINETGGAKEEEVLIAFAAWKMAPIAQRRIRPGEKLSAGAFVIQEINLALAPHKDLRGLILPADTDLSKLEANQTILEGQYPLTSAVRQTPDVLRGDAVKIRILSGGLTLSTSGVADEPGIMGGNLRVLSGKTKKQLMGKLMSDRSVEVIL